MSYHNIGLNLAPLTNPSVIYTHVLVYIIMLIFNIIIWTLLMLYSEYKKWLNYYVHGVFHT